MRVALISNVLPPEGLGGAEAYVAELANALTNDAETLVLTGSSTMPPNAKFRAVTLPSLPHLPRRESLPRKLLWHGRDQWRPSVFHAALSALRAFRPDVVHTNECQGLSAAVFSAIDALKLPHVHMAHDFNLICARVTMTRGGEFCGGRCALCQVQRVIRGRVIRRRLSKLVSVSEYVEQRHLAAGIATKESSEVIRLGVRAESRPREVRGDSLHIGFIGSLVPHKGILTLLDAFADAPPEWSLTIAGLGDCEHAVKHAAKADARITHLGYVTGAAKEAFFDGIDVLVIPSEWEEPAALAAIEAAARAVPAIVTDRGGLPEIAEARMIPAADPAALLEELTTLHANPKERSAISNRLRRRHHEFTWDRHYAEMLRLLDELAFDRRARVGAPSRLAPR